MSDTVIATEAAHDLIAHLKTRYGSLMFVQSGGGTRWQLPGLPARGRTAAWAERSAHRGNLRLPVLHRPRAVRALAQAAVPDRCCAGGKRHFFDRGT